MQAERVTEARVLNHNNIYPILHAESIPSPHFIEIESDDLNPHTQVCVRHRTRSSQMSLPDAPTRYSLGKGLRPA